MKFGYKLEQDKMLRYEVGWMDIAGVGQKRPAWMGMEGKIQAEREGGRGEAMI